MNKFYLLLTIFIKGGICVPPSPTNGLQEDIAEIKNNIHAFTGKFQRFLFLLMKSMPVVTIVSHFCSYFLRT